MSLPFETLEVDTFTGMRFAGFLLHTKGRLMLSEPTSASGLGLRRKTHWNFRRARDGSVVTRAGRICGARVIRDVATKEVQLVQFHLCSPPAHKGDV